MGCDFNLVVSMAGVEIGEDALGGTLPALFSIGVPQYRMTSWPSDPLTAHTAGDPHSR